MKYVRCNLCGADDAKQIMLGRDRLLHTDEQEFPVVKCQQCGLVYLNPQPTTDELVKYYSGEYGPFRQKQMFKYGPLSRLLKKIQKRVRKSRVLSSEQRPDETALNYLDFGCGDGKGLESVKKQHPNWNLYGLDNSRIACERAREKGFKIYCGDISEVSLPKNFFDKVMMSSVIEHVGDPRYVLTRLNQTMKPGGQIVIRTPNFRSLARMVFGRFWYALDTPRHLHLFTEQTLTQMLKKTGFEIQRVEYKRGPSVEIKSFFYLINKKDRRMNPIVWRLMTPLTNFLSAVGLASTLIVYAEKAVVIHNNHLHTLRSHL